MPTLDINARTLAKAIADAKPGAKQSEISDSRARGLKLRIGAHGATWQYRYERLGKGVRFDLGSVCDWSIAEARELAGAAAAHRRMGGMIDASWLQAQQVQRGRIEAPAPVLILSTFWTWETARSEFLAEVKRTLRLETYKDYRNRLRVPELSRFDGRPVETITRREMAVVLADIHARGVESQAEHVRDVVKSMWSFLMLDAVNEKSGVELPVMVGLRSPARTKKDEVRRGDYVPPIAEVGRLMAIARSGALEPRIGLAIQLLVFTCQRVSPVTKARRDGMRPVGNHQRGLWSMSAAHRKTADKRGAKADHIVPLPAPAWAVKEAAEALTEEMDHVRVFPGLRPQKEGNEIGALSTSAIQHTMSYLPGITATPHDIRRTFSNLAAAKFKWSIEDVKSILDHNEGQESGDVTVMNYLYDGSHAKWPMMEAWCRWVEEAATAAIADDRRLSDIEWIRAHVHRQRRIAKGRPVEPVDLVHPRTMRGSQDHSRASVPQ